jgi:hypothetical protein
LANYRNVFIVLIIAFVLHAIPVNAENKFQHFIGRLSLPAMIGYFLVCMYIAIQFKQAHAIKPVYLQF